ncbi:MAG: diaminopimelate epimerase [Bacteroidales bacterium]|nr:diaminopimelate epimerase [Bacteroidales bacterium]
MNFYKYHGTGNDFILLNNRDKSITLSTFDVRQLCDRKYGIGADGLILLNPSEQTDFEMVFYNNDGSTDTFCGNGGRCIAAFAHRLGIMDEKGCFLASDGVHQAEIISKHNHNEIVVRIGMKDCAMPQQFHDDIFFINTGSPHLVIFNDDIEALDVSLLGEQRSYDPRITGRANVNFVEKQPDHLAVRTFERGVEDETQSCGTGIVASALTYAAHFLKDTTQNVITVESRGGTLKVYYAKTDNTFHDVYLEGKATFVFEGKF